MPKLYHRMTRFAFKKAVSSHVAKRIKWALSLKPGDIINDCTGFNVKIIEVQPEVWQTGRGWYISNVDFKVTPFGGICSLIHCGIVPEISREKVEADWLVHTENYINSGALARWYGSDVDAYNEALKGMQKRIDVLKSGGHITNERGMILQEYLECQDTVTFYD